MLKKDIRYNIYDYLNYIKKNSNYKINYFDVGSSIGSTCIFALRLGFNTYAFEPSIYFDNLKKINLLNKFTFKKNFKIYNFAFSNNNKKKKIFYNPNNIGNISLKKKFIAKINKVNLKSHLVKCLTLDSFIKNNNIYKIDVIKLDVEGYIFEILEKSSNMFKLKPILILELDPKDNNLTKILDLLNKKNYQLRFYKKISCHDDYFFSHKDCVFLKMKINKIPLLSTKKNNKLGKIKRILKRIFKFELYGLYWTNLRNDITVD